MFKKLIYIVLILMTALSFVFLNSPRIYAAVLFTDDPYMQSESSSEVQYEYDEWNRVVKAIYSDGTIVVYEYDKNGNITGSKVTISQNTAEENSMEQSYTEVFSSDHIDSTDITTESIKSSENSKDNVSPDQRSESLEYQITYTEKNNENPSSSKVVSQLNSNEESNTGNSSSEVSEEYGTEQLTISDRNEDGLNNSEDSKQGQLIIVFGIAAAGLVSLAGFMEYRKKSGKKEDKGDEE